MDIVRSSSATAAAMSPGRSGALRVAAAGEAAPVPRWASTCQWASASAGRGAARAGASQRASVA
jgi:hypothetical protein